MKHLHLTSFVLLTFLVISAIKPPLHAQERKNLIQDYNFEVDNLDNHVKNACSCSNGNITLTNERAYEGNKSIRADQRATTDKGRAEVAFDDQPLGEYWAGWSMYFPSDFPSVTKNTGQAITQLHGKMNGGWVWALRIRDNAFAVSYRTSEGSSGERRLYDLMPVPKGTWVHFVAHYKVTEGSDNFFTLWANGKELYSYSGNLFKGDELYLKSGIYAGKSDNIAKTLWIDNMRIGDKNATVCDVNPAGAPVPGGINCHGGTTPPPPVADLSPCNGLVPESVRATDTQSPNVAANTMDCDASTRWSAEGKGETLTFDLGEEQSLDAVKLAFYKGNQRQTFFDLQVSGNGNDWMTVLNDQASSGTTTEAERFSFQAVSARYVRYVGQGNTVNDWNSVTEVEIHPAQDSQEEVALAVRARKIGGEADVVTLRIDGQEVESWTVASSNYELYTTTISEQQSQSSNIKLYFADSKPANDVQVDYLQIGERKYESEDQAVNTATWQNNSCGGSYSDKLYCQGYIAFSSSNNARFVGKTEKAKLTDQLPSAPWAYPSPTTGQVHLPLEQPTRIRVLDITGREVLRRQVQSSKQAVELDLTGQQEGLYFIHLEDNQQKRVLKVIKQ